MKELNDIKKCPFCGSEMESYISHGEPEVYHPLVKGCELSNIVFKPSFWQKRAS